MARGAAVRHAGIVPALAVLLAACDRAPPTQLAQTRVGEAEAGRALVRQVGCPACHTIPGVGAPRGTVGPTLDGFASRRLIAGRIPNQPELLARWVRNAPSFDPATGMPPMPLTETQARDVAAFLYTLDGG